MELLPNHFTPFMHSFLILSLLKAVKRCSCVIFVLHVVYVILIHMYIIIDDCDVIVM